MTRKISSTVLYLRTFRGVKSDNDMVAGLAEALSGLAVLVVMGPAQAEASLKRYWSRRYGDTSSMSHHLNYVVCTNDTWRREVHWQISKASCILFYLSPKKDRFPAFGPPKPVKNVEGIYSTPLFRNSSGQGLLQEVVYLRRLNRLPQTVLVCRLGDLQLINQMIDSPLVGADGGPLAGGYMWQETPEGLQGIAPRFSAFDGQLVSLQMVHGAVTFEPRELSKLPNQSDFVCQLRRAVRSVIWKDRWRRINPWVPMPRPETLLGRSGNPRVLPPDNAKKIIQFTNVEDLLYIPLYEVIDISAAEITRMLPMNAVEGGCVACNGPFSRLFFFVHALQRKEGEVIRARCQECLEMMTLRGNGLVW